MLRDAVWTADRLGADGAIPEIIEGWAELRENADVVVGQAVAVALGDLGPEAATADMLSLLAELPRDHDWQVRRAPRAAWVRLDADPHVIFILHRQDRSEPPVVGARIAGPAFTSLSATERPPVVAGSYGQA